MRLAEHFIAFYIIIVCFFYTGALILDSIYHITLKLLRNLYFWIENVKTFAIYTQCCYRHHYIMLLKMYTTSG